MSLNQYILVTGGAGYIGSHTVVELVQAGYTPVIVDDFRNSDRRVITRLEEITGKSIIWHDVDVCALDALRSVTSTYSFVGVIHFAAYKAVGESVENPLAYYHNNVLGMVNVLTLCKELEIPTFVFSSSCTVYGEPNGKKEVSENEPIGAASSPYGNTKVIGEQILNDLNVSGSSLKMLSLRYFNPIGAHPSAKIGELPVGKPNNLLPFITQTAIGKHAALTVFGNDYPTEDGTCVRDYIHVVDLAKAHVKGLEYLLSKEKPLLQQVNIGTGKGNSIMDVIQTFESETGVRLPWNFGPRRQGDVVEIFANTEKALALLNWKAELTLRDAVRDAWRWEQALENEA